MPIGLTHHFLSLMRRRRCARPPIAKIDKLAKLPTFGDTRPVISEKLPPAGSPRKADIAKLCRVPNLETDIPTNDFDTRLSFGQLISSFGVIIRFDLLAEQICVSVNRAIRLGCSNPSHCTSPQRSNLWPVPRM